MRIAQRGIEVMLTCAGLVIRITIGDQRKAQATVLAGEGAFPEPGHEIQVQRSPVPLRRHFQHGLTKLVFTIQVFDQIGLVDNIDKVDEFGGTPENLADAETQLPVLLHQPELQFADVCVPAFRIPAVQTHKGNKAAGKLVEVEGESKG